MNIKISFHNTPHSQALENHAREKLEKLTALFKNRNADHPLFIELFLNAQTAHTHHSAELHVKTNNVNVTTHDEGADMYVVAENTINKMIAVIKKEKEKNKEKKQRVKTEKTDFSS